jgi:hypothetical protein
MFGKKRVPGVAMIVDKRVVAQTSTGTAVVYEYVADVWTEGNPIFRTLLEEPHIAIDFASPAIGAQVRVEVDVEGQSARFDKSDPSLSLKALKHEREQRAAARIADALEHPAGTPHGTGGIQISFGPDGQPVVSGGRPLMTGGGTGPIVVMGGGAHADADPAAALAERLHKLDVIHQQGLVTDDEYTRLRTALLESI